MRAKFSALSFRYAFEGIWTAFKDQPNLIIHSFFGVFVVFLGYFFQITKAEWLVIILTIGLVITVEFTNTAIEEVVNSFTQETHPSAKKAKDVAAGAVLVAAITAAIVGLYIFLPYTLQFFAQLSRP